MPQPSCAFALVIVLLSCAAAQSEDLVNPPTAPPPVNGELKFTLEAKYATNRLFDPVKQAYDTVYLRSFNGGLIGPTLRARPGDTLEIAFVNSLPANPPDQAGEHSGMNTPHDFNTSNLHTHGLHVSPAGNSDNVLLSILPGQNFDYEIKIPEDHPAGTFWYHSHRHGSTAIQVASGMAGALIIEGSRKIEDKSKSGLADIDTILLKPDGTPFPDRIILINQTPYTCEAWTNVNDKLCRIAGTNAWDCPPGCVGVLETYDNFGPGTWTNSGRFATLNGLVQPTIRLRPGEIERWRFIDAGQRETIEVKLVKKPSSINMLTTTAAVGFRAAQTRLLAQLGADPAAVSFWEFAADGLTRDKITEKKEDVLQPGYRSDVLAFINQPGEYLLLDERVPADGSLNKVPVQRKILAYVTVEDDGADHPPIDPRDYLIAALTNAAQRVVPPPFRDSVVSNLVELDIRDFAPMKPVDINEVTGVQAALFNINVKTTPVRFEINGQPYSEKRIDRTLKLGGCDEWYIGASVITGHPYHIHVNPFQIVQILTPNGGDAFTTTDRNANPLYDQYKDLKGVWKDTIFAGPNYRIIVRTRYEKYIGEFVLHCHILDHEDQGMMENVRIVP